MKPISVVVMDNLIGDNIQDVISIYDLKGSTHRRITKKIKNERTVKKDLNFLLEPQFIMRLDSKEQKDLAMRIQRDKEFLKSCNLMDYSLLMIFLKKKDIEEEFDGFADKAKQMSVFITRGEHGDNVEMEEVPAHMKHDRGESTIRHKSTTQKMMFLESDQDVMPLPRKSAIEDWRMPSEEHDSDDVSNSHSHSHNSLLQPRTRDYIQY